MTKKFKISWLIILFGCFCILSSFILTCRNVQEDERGGESAETNLASVRDIVSDARKTTEVLYQSKDFTPDYLLTESTTMPTENVDGYDYIGIISIPSLGLELPVISEWSYPALRVAPCRYTGSVYTDNMILAAHNYRTHFGNIGNLVAGDYVTFEDIEGNAFHYQVSHIETLEKPDVEGMQAGECDLTLFTCTIGGAKRVTVRCDRIDDAEVLS